jgi:hypothetical protein
MQHLRNRLLSLCHLTDQGLPVGAGTVNIVQNILSSLAVLSLNVHSAHPILSEVVRHRVLLPLLPWWFSNHLLARVPVSSVSPVSTCHELSNSQLVSADGLVCMNTLQSAAAAERS